MKVLQMKSKDSRNELDWWMFYDLSEKGDGKCVAYAHTRDFPTASAFLKAKVKPLKYDDNEIKVIAQTWNRKDGSVSSLVLEKGKTASEMRDFVQESNRRA